MNFTDYLDFPIKKTPGQQQLVCQNNHETIIDNIINVFNKLRRAEIKFL